MKMPITDRTEATADALFLSGHRGMRLPAGPRDTGNTRMKNPDAAGFGHPLREVPAYFFSAVFFIFASASAMSLFVSAMK